MEKRGVIDENTPVLAPVKGCKRCGSDSPCDQEGPLLKEAIDARQASPMNAAIDAARDATLDNKKA